LGDDRAKGFDRALGHGLQRFPGRFGEFFAEFGQIAQTWLSAARPGLLGRSDVEGESMTDRSTNRSTIRSTDRSTGG
jgi:hypothetical protein